MTRVFWHRPGPALALMAILWAPAQASASPPCPIPENLRLRDINLPRMRAAVERERKLVILTLGGAATLGQAAGDPTATYPARLQALLAVAMPGIDVQVMNRADVQRGGSATLPRLAKLITETGARLVIWASGAREAARSTDIEDYIQYLQSGIDTIHQAGADVILMDPQYAPSIARITNTEPYRQALHGTAVAHEASVLQRYDLMMHWNDEGVMNLDAQDKQERQNVARHVFACIATALAPAIIQAAK